MTGEQIKEYFANTNLRKVPKKGLHFEQKTTPDLIWCVSYTILNIIKDDKNKIFSDKEDVRKSEIFNSFMQDYFSKPPQEKAENEYNKISSYQLDFLTNAGILKKVADRPKKYRVKEFEILEFLSINDLNSSKFLTEYVEKFLKDNDLLETFNIYKNQPNQENHIKVKDKYWEWAKVNTNIKGEDRKHTYRVFNKIFNVFCYKNNIPGEDASNITSGPCPYSFLIYNRKNFRDKDKPTGMTREEYMNQIFSEVDQNGVVETLLSKVKESIKQKYNLDSEIKEREFDYTPNSGVHVHHILPQSSYPQFSLSRENLICLTPGQHLSLAHEKGNTKRTNGKFQLFCLKRKLENIITSLNNGEDFYNFDEFLEMIKSFDLTFSIIEAKPKEVLVYLDTLYSNNN